MTTQYKNTGGQHTQGNGNVVPTGGTFIDPDDNLASKFVGKFEVLARVDGTNDPQAPENTTPPGTGTEGEKSNTDHSEADGEDVTAEFPTAVEHGLKIIKTKKGWVVYDADGVSINDEPLRKKDVDDVINEWVAD